MRWHEAIRWRTWSPILLALSIAGWIASLLLRPAGGLRYLTIFLVCFSMACVVFARRWTSRERPSATPPETSARSSPIPSDSPSPDSEELEPNRPSDTTPLSKDGEAVDSRPPTGQADMTVRLQFLGALLGVLAPTLNIVYTTTRDANGPPPPIPAESHLPQESQVTPRTSPALSQGLADWQYRLVEGVGDTDGNGAREVLVIEDDGTGTLFELGANDALVNPLPTFHDWTPYELVTGVGNVDGDPPPEIFVVDGEDGWLLGRTSGGQWVEEENSIEFGRDWSYERIAGVADVDGSGVPEILGANWAGRGDIDELMYLEPSGRYSPDEHRHEVVPEEGDYDWITGVGDVDGNGRPEVLAAIGTRGFLLSFCPNATHLRTELGSGWDYDFLTSLRVFGDPGESAALGVDDGEAVIRKFGSLKKDKRECRRRSVARATTRETYTIRAR